MASHGQSRTNYGRFTNRSAVERDPEIVKALGDGLSYEEVARQFGVHVDTVKRAEERCNTALEKFGSKPVAYRADPSQDEEIWHLTSLGCTQKEIMESLGIGSNHTITEALRRYAERVRAEGAEVMKAKLTLRHEHSYRMNAQRAQQLYDDPPPRVTPQGVPAKRKVYDSEGNFVREEVLADLLAYRDADEQGRKHLRNISELWGVDEPKKNVKYNVNVEEMKRRVLQFATAIETGELPEAEILED